MVCLGNICRSPLAEGILTHRAQCAGLAWHVDSAGTGNWHKGEPPHRLSQLVAARHGIDISGQKARQFSAGDLQRFDRIYFMDEDNLADGRRMAGALWQTQKTSLLLSVLPNAALTNVPDPYHGTEVEFEAVFQMIDSACMAIVEIHRQ
jgi:protein-tyrosine phosphatase